MRARERCARRASGAANKPREGRLERPTARQAAFARHYLAFGSRTYLNATASALAAGYSKATVQGGVQELLDHPNVQKEMRRIREQRASRSTIAGPEEVLEAVTMILRADPRGLFSGGEAIVPDRLPKELAVAITGVKNATTASGDRRFEYRLADRLRAAEMLARHYGLFETDNFQRGAAEVAARLVGFPTEEVSLEQWQRLASELLAKHGAAAVYQGKEGSAA